MMTEAEKKAEESEKKKISIISVSGGMIWTILSTVLGAYLGTAGTLYGAALGTGAGSVWAVWYENFATRALAKAKARKKQEQAEAAAISPAGRERLGRNREMLTREIEQDYLSRRHRNPWKTAFFATAMAGFCFLVTVGAVLVAEKATGKTLHGDLTGARQYGTSFSYSTVAPSAVPQTSSPPPSPLSASADASPSATPSATVSASPDASPDSSPTGGASSVLPSSRSSSTAPGSTQPGETAPAVNAVPSSSMTTAP
jgi:hypothetical protein